MIVMKFGGTSNQDAAAMRNVLQIVRSRLHEKPVVVISAIAKATNELEQTARTAASGDEHGAVIVVTKLFERHYTILDNLIQSRELAKEIEAVFFNYLVEIKALLKGVAILRELTPRTMDAICSYGERLSSRIIAGGLQEAGVNSVWVDVKDFMVTDDSFGWAQPLMDVVEKKLQEKVRPLLDAGKTPVTQGFIGVTQSGAPTTMGRESSDYSASIIGAAMEADRVEIWTDVDGILTADPRMVQDTRNVRRLSFEEAFELSFFGAKVLHPSTMLPVLEKKIPVHILNSFRAGGPGTVVDVMQAAESAEGPIKSIAFRRGITVVAVSPRKRMGQYLFWDQIYSVLTQHGIVAGLTATSEYSISLALESKLVDDGFLHALERFGRVETAAQKASVCVVGRDMRNRPGMMGRVFHAIAGMNVSMVSYGASGLNVTFVLDEDRIPEALGRLHKEFFGGPHLHATSS